MDFGGVGVRWGVGGLKSTWGGALPTTSGALKKLRHGDSVVS